MNKKWINRTSHISQWTGSFVHRRTRYWELVRLLEVREGEGGGREFLVQWAGEDRNGDPWPNDWQPEKNVTADAICEFEFSCAVMNDLQLNGLDVRPLLSLARKKIANALLTCKQKEIASMHSIPLEFLAHEKLCRAFFLPLPPALRCCPTSRRRSPRSTGWPPPCWTSKRPTSTFS